MRSLHTSIVEVGLESAFGGSTPVESAIPQLDPDQQEEAKGDIVHIGQSEDQTKKAAEKSDKIMEAHRRGETKEKKKDQVVSVDMNDMDLSKYQLQ